MRRLNQLRHTFLILSAVAGMWVTSTNTANAQITLDQYRTAPTVYDGFAVSRPDDRGHLKFGVHLTLDYANDPLVYESRVGDADSESTRVVEHQLVGSLALHLGLWDRLVIFAGMPVTLWMDGDPLPLGAGADSTGAGDPWAGLRLRLVGDNEDIFGLGVQGIVTFPVAKAADKNEQYLGENGVTFQPALLAELRPGPVRITVNAGLLLRKKHVDGLLLSAGNEFRWSAALSVDLVKKRLVASGEVSGATPLGKITDGVSFGDREGSPLEAIAGLKYFSPKGVSLGLAGGPGILRGYGSPDFRAIVQLGFGAREDEPAVTPAKVGDTDGDGLNDDVDQCPAEPEDRDNFEDDDGCPDPDNDQDGVLDINDGAPLDPEDKDGFEDANGVPDPDNDMDGILDSGDKCPNEAEDLDGYEDDDGCPDPDNDQDTVLDKEDRCPTAPGQPSENPEENGCPKTVRMDSATGQILILKRVEFATAKDVILASSDPILEEVRATIAANKQIKRIRVEGHTDDRGDGAKNQELSKRRARSVMRWLVGKGIEGERIEAFGCGENVPMETNKTSEGRQANRRVEFHIVDPAPASGARSTNGCEQISGE